MVVVHLSYPHHQSAFRRQDIVDALLLHRPRPWSHLRRPWN
ncbi:hypothetical protein LINPERHAP2_LOCUS13963 [Linum perenne]